MSSPTREGITAFMDEGLARLEALPDPAEANVAHEPSFVVVVLVDESDPNLVLGILAPDSDLTLEYVGCDKECLDVSPGSTIRRFAGHRGWVPVAVVPSNDEAAAVWMSLLAEAMGRPARTSGSHALDSEALPLGPGAWEPMALRPGETLGIGGK